MQAYDSGKTDVDKLICRYIDALGMLKFGMFREVSNTLDRIPNLAKRLLALRGYLRKEEKGPGTVHRRWAFTKEQYDEFKTSAAGVVLNSELQKVKNRFREITDKKYKLGHGKKFRSLDRQVKYWNTRSNVQNIADQILQKVRKRVTAKSAQSGLSDGPSYPQIEEYADRFQLTFKVAMRPSAIARNPNAAGIAEKDAVFNQLQKALDDFAEYLRKTTFSGELKTATPGISDHGRSQAIDFGVRDSSGTKICGASSASTWRSTGMASHLASAMKASKHFEGPLKSPDEPWHWEFHA